MISILRALTFVSLIMKIAHIATIDYSIRYLLLNQLRSIKQAGYEVASISASGPNEPVIESVGIRHIAVPMTRRVTPLADLWALWQLARILRRERFTIVHCHTPKAELLGQVAARLAGVPVVVGTFRGIYYRPDMHPLWRRLFMLMARLAAGRADLILSQSKEAMATAVREGICSPEKIKLLGNGIDVRRFDRRSLNPVEVAQLRQSLEIAPDVPVVGFVGRLVREKGILELLQAGRIVRKRFPEVQFLIVGPLDDEKADALTPAVAQEYGLADAFTFTGLRNDMPECYAMMDLFVMPSHRESFPRSPMEASAMGVPCVVTDIPGCREAVEQERNGLLIPLGDVQALAGAIMVLLTDKEKARQMGATGRQMAEERFDEELIFATVKAEYARLLQEKGLAVPEGGRMIFN